MSTRPDLTPCIICEKAVIYLWDNNNSRNLNGAADVSIRGYHGSDFDTVEFAGIICDECLNKLVQSRRLTLSQYHYEP